MALKDLPFSDYDFFGYLVSGFVFLFALDHVVETGWIIRSSWTVVDGLFVTACAYIVGHLLAGLSSAVIERQIVARWIGRPSLLLFGVNNRPPLFRRMLASYYEPLPQKTRELVMQKASRDGIAKPGEELFWFCFNSARNNEAAMERTSAFLNLYGLCRNLAFTAILSSLILVVKALWCNQPEDYLWAAAALVVGLGMFLRYLKFYRHYAMEVFTCAAHEKQRP